MILKLDYDNIWKENYKHILKIKSDLNIPNKLSDGIFKIDPYQAISSQECKDDLTLGKKIISMNHYSS